PGGQAIPVRLWKTISRCAGIGCTELQIVWSVQARRYEKLSVRIDTCPVVVEKTPLLSSGRPTKPSGGSSVQPGGLKFSRRPLLPFGEAEGPSSKLAAFLREVGNNSGGGGHPREAAIGRIGRPVDALFLAGR